MTSLPMKSANEMSRDRTDLSARRTMMGADRSLMAWIRTSLAMISFGFTVYKLLQGIEQSGMALPGGSSPRNLGLFLTGLGTVAMVMGTIDYFHTIRTLRLYGEFSVWRPSFVFALIMSATGLVLFVTIIERIL
jgi:putative membrane protein